MANLAALLEKEASAEIEAILSEARARASEIVAKAEEDAEASVAQKQRALAAQHEAALVRAKSAAQLEAASLKLRAQHKAVETVFDKVKVEIDALIQDPKRYAPVLTGLLAEALAGVGKDNLAGVVVNPGEKEVAEAVLEVEGLKAPLQTDGSVRGGVRLRAKGANISIENTLPARLEALRGELASEVSKLLFYQRATQGTEQGA